MRGEAIHLLSVKDENLKKEITLKDVAEAAGVSKMTASRALRGANDVSKVNVEKVKKAAKEIGYVGNHLAASLTKTNSNLIGVVLPNLTNIVFSHVMSGITGALDDTIFQPVFGVSDYDEEKEYEVIKNILSWRPAGLIVTGTNFPESTKLILRQAKIPLVQIMDTDGDIIDSVVGFSHEKAGYDMARALLETGRERIGFIGCIIENDFRAAKRKSGFIRALDEAGHNLVCDYNVDSVSTISVGRGLVDEALSAHPELDCIYFSNDDIAAGALFRCIEKQIAVPEDLALIGFNGMDISNCFPGKLGTSVTDRAGIGSAAAKILLRRCTGEMSIESEKIVLEPQIRLGNLLENSSNS